MQRLTDSILLLEDNLMFWFALRQTATF